MRAYGVARAHDEDKQVDRLPVERLEVEPLLDGGGHHAHAVHVVNLCVGDGKPATDTGGTALLAVPYGFENFVPVLELVRVAQGVNQFVQDSFLGRARGVDQDAVVDESFRKSHVSIPLLYSTNILAK